MADLNRTVGILFTAEDRGSPVADAIARKLREAGDAAGDASGKTAQLDRELDKLGGNVPKISALAAGLQTLAASLVVKAFIDANVEAEKFSRSMTLLTGSSAEAAAKFSYVSTTANTLGISVDVAARSYTGLFAATNGTNLAGADTRLIFEAVAKAMSALGKSGAETEGAFKAIEQIVSKGTVSLEEIRGQLGERLPGAFQIAARSVGLTTQEFDKLVSSGGLVAERFLPAFAAELNKTFGNATFEGYTASLARLRNSIDANLRLVGEAGAFDVLTSGVRGLGTAAAVTSVGLKTFSGFIKAAYDLASTGDLRKFERDLQNVDIETARAALTIKGELNESLAETQRLLRQENVNTLPEAFSDARFEASRLSEEAKKTDAALKTLGLDPKKFDKDVSAIQDAFKRLTSDPAVSGDTILAGLKKTLEQLKTGDQVNEVIGQLSTAFTEGRLSANQYAEQVNLAKTRILELSDGFTGSTKTAKAQEDQLKKNEAATKKAEEETRKYALELEKLASNERIKNIEARVTLKVAELENDTKRVIAAFESIDNTVNSTGKSIGDLFGLFKDQNLTMSQLSLIRDQIDKENVRRDNALKLQGDLTRAQIDKMKAQTDAISKGDALIKIDGAGLQPHLEAFMWEILRTVQTRVNQDGLKLLLGA